MPLNMNLLQRLKQINCFVFDVDGVLTDGTLLVMPGGLMVRKMNIKDGYALQLAIKMGYRVLIISGGNSMEVKDRLQKLGVTEIWMQVTDKRTLLDDYLTQNNIPVESVAYMGDDIPDREVMQLTGLPCCPADAAQDIKEVSLYISHLKGGEGCGRDVIEKVMKLRGNWIEDISVRSQ
jgi:3-deoxy-D-manno-octulosonate 8-phosphate phosphatase (KDO 8-P phosphatase)